MALAPHGLTSSFRSLADPRSRRASFRASERDLLSESMVRWAEAASRSRTERRFSMSAVSWLSWMSWLSRCDEKATVTLERC